MKTSSAILQRLVSTCVLVVAATAFGAEPQSWVPLFDGHTLNNWEQKNGLAHYDVADGTIVGTSVPNSPNSFLCTKKNYADFELQFEVKVDKELNSGVQIRSASKSNYQDGRVHGYQVEIAVDGFSGGIYDEARRGKFLNAQPAGPEIRALLKENQWNQYRVLCEGSHIQVWVNGVQVTDLNDDMTGSGFFGLQVHGVGARTEPLHVAWRNLRIREIK